MRPLHIASLAAALMGGFFVPASSQTYPGPGINQPSTGQWFSQNNASIQRFNDRVMVGGATVGDGAFPNATKDWLSTFQVAAGLSAGAPTTSELVVLTQPSAASASGAGGILGGAQSLNSTSAGTSTIGLSSYSVNNNATLATTAWGIYAECHNANATVLACYGIETDTRSTVATITPNSFLQGSATGYQVGCGAGLASTNDCSAAIQIVANPNKWKTGINVFNTALNTGVGNAGGGVALEMATLQELRWDSASGVTRAELWGSTAGLNAKSGNQNFIFDTNGHIAITPSAGPTITAGCNGAGSSVGTGSSDFDGNITGQTAAATTCTITFGTAFTNTPSCETSGDQSAILTQTRATNTLVVTFASTANYRFNWHCGGV